MFKKVLSLVLAGALLVGATACSKKDEASQTADVPELRWVFPGSSSKMAELPEVVEKANEIIEAEIGARLKVELVDDGSYSEKLKLLMASGDDFDLCFTSNWLNDYYSAANSSGLMDITDYIDEATKAVIPDYALEAAKIKGRIYGIPNVQVMTHPLAMYIDREIYEKYKDQVDFLQIEQIDELEPLLELIKKDYPDKYAFHTLWGVQAWTLPVYEKILGTNMVIRCDGTDPEAKFIVDTPEYQHGVRKLHEWYEKGYIRADVASAGDDSSDRKAGKYVIMFEKWKPGLDETYPDRVYKTLYSPYLEFSGPLQAMTGVGAKSKNPELAVKLIQLMNSNQELYNLMCYGIEGKHYTKNEDGSVSYVEGSKYAPKADWKWGNQFNAYIPEGVDKSVWDQTNKMNEEASKSPLLGFVPDLKEIRAEISQISNINSEFNTLSHGAGDTEKLLADYKAKLESAGQKKVEEEIKRQVSEFLANK